MLTVTQTPTIDHPQPAKVLARGTLPALGDCPCAVVQLPGSGEIVRVLSARQFRRSLGLNPTTKTAGGSDVKTPGFTLPKSVMPFITNSIEVTSKSIEYAASGGLIHGYRAELLPHICIAYVRALVAGALRPSQIHIAEHCAALIEAFGTIGIAALIDEASGYQEHRPTDALHELFKAYLREVPGPKQTVFPARYYAEVHRLLRLRYTPGCSQHPRAVAFFTKRFVHRVVIPPLVMTEMDRLNPLSDSFARNQAIHRWLTEEHGLVAVRAQVARVTDRAILAADMPHFLSLTARAEGDPQRVWSFVDTARYPEVPHA